MLNHITLVYLQIGCVVTNICSNIIHNIGPSTEASLKCRAKLAVYKLM